MKYYTRHELEVQQGSNDLIQELRLDYASAEYAIDRNGNTKNTATWYEHEADMKLFSSKHPEALFMLSGEGQGLDLWRQYYKNGKVQHCKGVITYPAFNSDLLD